MTTTRSGFVALVGRPNVGKSTLLNRLVGQKVSIVTPRPQTTRHRVIGVRTSDEGQIVFVDTPGMHKGGRHAINRAMNRAAAGAIADADVAVLMVEALKFTDEDRAALERVVAAGVPAGLVVNKVDRVADKSALLPYIESLRSQAEFVFVVPLSAERGENCDALLAELHARLPEGPLLYPEDQVTDRSMRFVVTEVVREKLMLRLREEIPYGLTVEIEAYEDGPQRTDIAAVVWVARESHKGIVIGKGGTMLRDVGTAARRELESMLERKVFLRLHVKVREDWVDDEQALRRFGYE